MARLNVYLPDDLAAQARAAGLNVSALTRAAVESELAEDARAAWLDRAAALTPLRVDHEQVLDAIDAAREDLERDRGA